MSATLTPNARTAVPHAQNVWTCAQQHVSAVPRHNARAALARALEAPSPPAPIGATPPPATFADSPRLAELLALLHLGLLSNRVGTRVAEITRDNHPDALARLERAANHLHLTGSNATTLLARSIAHGPTPARDYLSPLDAAGRKHRAQPVPPVVRP